MRRYFKEKESGRILTKTMEIKNGVILGEVNESDGLHIHGTEFFVNHEEFKKGYEKTKFTPHPDTVAKGIIASALKDVVYELNNYGLMEELVRSFEEAVDSSPDYCIFYHDVVNGREFAVKRFYEFLEESYDFHHECPQLSAFLSGGLYQIMVKMLNQYKEALTAESKKEDDYKK